MLVPNTNHLISIRAGNVHKVKTNADLGGERQNLLLWNSSFRIAVGVVIAGLVCYVIIASVYWHGASARMKTTLAEDEGLQHLLDHRRVAKSRSRSIQYRVSFLMFCRL